ncbi:MAG: bifunctional 2-polyprenyl-6-hydroxyphenol methylase/3-demethylubiquinol 3-O-methyltransferase UbiG [Chromatiales bacterium]|nr:bifunctional 2-polyprenyl-6-hydroxyphenol methylase/3-demethylubiquinol 3-O-methyltransferase UbiG [Chromatiales bacterium]
MNPASNVDPREVQHFSALASRWWDPDGEFASLHRINPLRLEFIGRCAPPAGRRCLDVGCGGGLLSEGLARLGGEVTGIDLAPASLAVARLHLLESSGLTVNYRQVSAGELALEFPGRWQLVTCMEVLEHVPDPESLMGDLARLAAPGGDIVVATLNRSLKSFLGAIVAAEYVLGMVPRGTHRYDQLIRPSELESWGRKHGLKLAGMSGIRLDPFGGSFSLSEDVSINYMMHFRVPAR